MASPNLIRAGGAFVEVGADLGPLERGLSAAKAKLKAFSQSVKEVGKSMLLAGAAIGVPLAKATHVFSDFESAMALVRAVTEDITDDSFAKLEAKARSIGRTTGYTAIQAAEGMAALASAGFKARDVFDSIEPTLKLTAAAQIEVKDAAAAAARVLNDMGFTAQQLPKVFDVMVRAAKSGGTSVTDLAQSMKFVGPIANIAGVELTEVVAAIQLLGKSGIDAEMAGTALRGITLDLVAPTEKSRQALEGLNIQVLDSKKNFRGIIPIIADLEKALQGVGTGERTQKLAEIFERRPVTGMAALINKGSAAIAAQNQKLIHSTGIMETVAEMRMNTVRGAFLKVMGAVEGVAISIGQSLVPVLRPLAGVVQGIANSFSLWIEKNRQVVQTAFQVAAGLVGAGAAMVAFAMATKAVAGAIGLVALASRALRVATLLWLAPFGLVPGVIAGVVGALGGMDAALGTVAFAFAALSVGPVLFKAIAKAIAIATVAGSAMAAVLKVSIATFGVFMGVVVGGLSMVIPALAASAAAIAAWSRGGQQAMEDLGRQARNAGAGIVETLRSVIRNSRSVVMDVKLAIDLGDFESAMTLVLLGLQAAFQELWKDFQSGGSRMLDNLSGTFIKFFYGLNATAKGAWTEVMDHFHTGWLKLVLKLRESWANTVAFMKRLVLPFNSLIGQGQKRANEIEAERQSSVNESIADYNKASAAKADVVGKAYREIEAERLAHEKRVDAVVERNRRLRNEEEKAREAEERGDIGALIAKRVAASVEFRLRQESLGRAVSGLRGPGDFLNVFKAGGVLASALSFADAMAARDDAAAAVDDKGGVAATRDRAARIREELAARKEFADWLKNFREMGPQMPPPDIVKKIPDVTRTLGELKGDVAGTFFGGAAHLMGGRTVVGTMASAAERTANNTEKMAADVKKIAEKGPLVFDE